jgi:methylmalonyl-CoA/ethylmalonyl-CoA epimerase
MRQFQEGATMQVAMIVRDLEAAMKRHWETCKIGPWDIYKFEPGKVENFLYRGSPATHTCLIAVVWSGDTQLELIQPLTGYSIYDEHLESRGEGLHHIKLFHSDCQKAIADYQRRGYPVIQCGRRTNTTISIGVVAWIPSRWSRLAGIVEGFPIHAE